MVLSKLMWKSLDVYENLYSYLWKRPVKWDSQKCKFIYVPFSPILYPWVAVMSYSVLQVLTCWVLISLWLFGLVELSKVHVTIVIGTFSLILFASLVEIGYWRWGKIMSAAFNELNDLETRSSSGSPITRSKSTPVLGSDPTAEFLIMTSIYFATFTHYCIPLGIFFQLDVYSQIFSKIISTYPIHNLSLLIIFKFTQLFVSGSTFFCCIMGCRAINGIIQLLTICANLALGCLSNFARKSSILQVILDYRGIQIILNLAQM
ncbi:hypothetical protein Fcan01_00075 [Folsomia candida]|uniref:Uncharacterized protein n=1 Tax=Folsomia candida TaxID=158441 RepID=A0A226F1J8_FOLCA|nr:hypothetical protein Fcan01_00075 [Folsomia candida]